MLRFPRVPLQPLSAVSLKTTSARWSSPPLTNCDHAQSTLRHSVITSVIACKQIKSRSNAFPQQTKSQTFSPNPSHAQRLNACETFCSSGESLRGSVDKASTASRRLSPCQNDKFVRPMRQCEHAYACIKNKRKSNEQHCPKQLAQNNSSQSRFQI